MPQNKETQQGDNGTQEGSPAAEQRFPIARKVRNVEGERWVIERHRTPEVVTRSSEGSERLDVVDQSGAADDDSRQDKEENLLEHAGCRGDGHKRSEERRV